MKAIVHTKGGPPEVLHLKEVETPTPGDDEVRVRIHATTVTFGDAVLRRVRGPLRWVFKLAFGLGRNNILGHEFAGEIDSKGKNVTRFEVGDPVFGSTGKKGGAYAEYICIPEEGMLAGRPVNMTYEQAAAVPIGGNTALDILRKANIQPGQNVLVYGASGSVGTYAVQLARHFGGEVSGVCSTTNLDLVKSLGAEKVIDYTQADFTQSGERYDVIFDAVGKISSSKCKGALKEEGVFLSVNTPTSEKVEDLIFLKKLAETGEIKAVIDRRYPLDQIVEAHRYVDTGRKKGNVVITIGEPLIVAGSHISAF